MFPKICTIGPFPVYSYGFMMAVAAIVCYWLMSREAKPMGISADLISDLLFWCVVGGIAGARLFYIFLNFDFFVTYPLEIVMLQHGGLAWQGGLIGGFLAGFIFMRKKSLSLGLWLDFLAPYIALGQSIGRIGCFLNGCCQGKEVSWGIYMPVHHAHLHPTQLYSFAGLLVVFVILRMLRKVMKKQGQLFVCYVILSSTLRIFVQTFRADHVPIWGGFSFFQLVSMALIISACAGYFVIDRIGSSRKSQP